ncbi:MAG: hypothetical protein FJX74_23745, partial [Armatimonadetes bacterium]|nr:hypothetical protein [Armatimonadota bacterium]
MGFQAQHTTFPGPRGMGGRLAAIRPPAPTPRRSAPNGEWCRSPVPKPFATGAPHRRRPMDENPLARSAEEVNRLFPWLREELIRGIPHFISPAWTTDRSRFDPEHWAECWERIGFRSVTLLTGHHDGYLLYPSAHSRQRPDRDYFGEQVEACRRRGIRVLAYYSLTLDSLVGSEHPEWRVRDMEGRIHQPDYRGFSHYHWLCLNSPYRDFAVAQLEEVVTRYGVDGVWIDILYLPEHPADLTRDTCFCDGCHRRYSEWYAGEHLLDAAGTSRHDGFRARTYREFLVQLKRMLLRQPRPIALTFNGAGRRRKPFYQVCDELADFLSGEAHNPVALSVTSKSHRNDGRPFELLSCAEICWSHNQLKPETLVKLESLATLLAGGTYTIGITHAPDGRLSGTCVNRLADWSAWVRERESLLRPCEPVHELALLANEGGPAGCEAWATLLRKGHCQFNVLMDVDPVALEACGMVAVPHSRRLSADEAEALRAYVERGGRLLLEYPADQPGQGARHLEGLIGARRVRDEAAYAFYLSPDEAALSADLPEGEPVLIHHGSALVTELTTGRAVGLLVPQFRDKLRTSDIQTVPNYWAREDEAERPPGIILNDLGRGRVMTTALPLTGANPHADRCPWPEVLAQNCVRYLLGEQLVSAGPYARLELALTRQSDRLILHVLNHAYGPGESIQARGEEDVLREVPITLRSDLRQQITRATLEPEGEPVALTEEGFVLPRV